MTHRLALFALLALTALLLPGCDAAVAIFEAGWWLGLIIAALVIGIIVWIVSRAKR